MSAPIRKAPWVIGALVVVLGLLHQDFWFWSDSTLVFGFLPVGLFYHALYSIAAGCLWAAAVKWAWPSEVEAFAEEADDAPPPRKTAADPPGDEASEQAPSV
jgi:hypothetical protein